MSYCVNCGVELDETAKKCALCSTPVINPNIEVDINKEPPFSRQTHDIPQIIKKRFVALLATTIIFIPVIICVLANIFVFSKSSWSLHVVSAALLVWVIFVFPFLTKKLSAYLMLCFDTAAVSAYAFMLTFLLNHNLSVYLECTLPVILCNSILILIYMLFAKRKKRHWLLKTLLIFSLLAVSSLISGSLISIEGGVKYAFEIGTILFVSLIAIVAFLAYCYSSKSIRKWLSKKLFV